MLWRHVTSLYCHIIFLYKKIMAMNEKQVFTIAPITAVTSRLGDVTMSPMASQITSLTIVYSTVCSGADQRKHKSSASLAFVRGILRGPGNSPHKWSVTRKMFPFDDVIMTHQIAKTTGSTSFYTSIRHFRVGTISNRCRSEGFCYLGQLNISWYIQHITQQRHTRMEICVTNPY